ncbi:Wall-associated receptor kinase 2 [Carex littledalei]|uniref:Wall-associated receptor kinase 2 n=1 Tax=Carex littledalei TaxID=544730 RepID=A0A833VHH9_9POAL|nr:Wall-associated receptor kinase 2 [Carex littledalei]
MAKPGCQDRCGSVDIPYPFGIGTDCSRGGFTLSCNTSKSGEKMVPFHGNVEVLNITLSTAQARLYNYIARQCTSSGRSWMNLTFTIYRLSEFDNRFTVIGCETLAFNEMNGYNGTKYRTGCVSTCYNPESLRNGSCSGNGCCQTSIPSGINYYNISFDSNYNNGDCSYAVIMATDSFNFSTSYISTNGFWDKHNGSVPVVLDWSIGTKKCEVAKANLNNYACVSNNSDCFDARNGPGYICKCKSGYQGNPYLLDGCEVIGCQTLAFNEMNGYNGTKYRTGCVSTCYNPESLRDGSCSGNGCCQTSIPSGINYYNISFDSNYNNGNCSYAVIMATDSFNFSTSYIFTTGFWDKHNGTVPVVLDWSIGTEKCEVAKANMNNYACVSNNSYCVDSRNGPGYICNCSSGYQGNPYFLDGCEDTNECNDNLACSGTCINTQGSYKCICPQGTQGDATKNGRCYPVVHSQTLSPLAKLAIGVSVGLLLLLFLSFSTYIIRERRRLASIREKHFQQYGGRLLLEEMRSNHGNAFTIFTEEELKEATNNFDEANMLGQGGNGTVYKGTVESSEDVAIKKCKIINERNKKEFGKEMLILSQINHKNIVRIIGCCLEVEIPILVYEFIQKGTLFDLLHFNSASRFSFSMRIRIAQEAAEALAYMHSAMKEKKIEEILDDQILDEENMNLITGVAEIARECLNMEGEKRPEMRDVAEGIDKLRKTMKHPWGQDDSKEMESLLRKPSNNHELEMISDHSLEKKAMLVMETGR